MLGVGTWECLANFSPSFYLHLFGRDALIIGASLLLLDHMIIVATMLFLDHMIIGASLLLLDHMIVGATLLGLDHMTTINFLCAGRVQGGQEAGRETCAPL